ncbi:U6 small nuclear RNA (adenine-(43)-N(6))-methyltransferase-like protein [Elsinoe australis]|uniref:U6 small nuclear RNA (Adenine-(43)-N(6))-methyltransferase-like protein n=1 Tax=Elsinoe australis TaxID=40998 RepID=A0A4U7AXJ4_9PEZI|nr:U6 small nuclear RNA (adenine-(43)-N(6))-methyltransferase-like protein [Elsinoe australis]
MSSVPDPELNYDDGIDFDELYTNDSDFAKHYRNGKFNFQDPDAVQYIPFLPSQAHSADGPGQLTKSLLKRDFNLSLALPPDRLCPPIPIRWSYILFITRLLSSTTHPLSTPTPLTGLDIGTGASAIYALLFTSPHCPLSHPPTSLKMHATEIDAPSLVSAATNIATNALSSRITLHHTAPSSPLIPLDALALPNLDFTVCNPPFYTSAEDLASSFEGKVRPPSAVCTGSETEMICPGGDAGFVGRMVEESVQLGTRVRWYSSMLGKLGSVYEVVGMLKEQGCGNWVVQVLKGGRWTRRWVVAWSWGEERAEMGLVRGMEVPRGLWGVGTEQSVLVDGGREVVRERLDGILGGLDVGWRWWEEEWGVGEARENVWSRAARRKRKRNDAGQIDGGMDVEKGWSEESRSTALAFKIEIQDRGLNVRWLRGKDPVLFESFCGMLKRAMNSK